MNQTCAVPSPEKRALTASTSPKLPGAKETVPFLPKTKSSRRKKSTSPLKKANPWTPPEGYMCEICNLPGHYLSSCPTNESVDRANMDSSKTEQENKGREPKKAKTQSNLSKRVQDVLASFADCDEEKEEEPAKEPSPKIRLGVTEKKVVGNPAYSPFIQSLFKNRPNPYINKPKRKTAAEIWTELDQKKMESIKIGDPEDINRLTISPQGSTQVAVDTAGASPDTASAVAAEVPSSLEPQSTPGEVTPKDETDSDDTADGQVMSD